MRDFPIAAREAEWLQTNSVDINLYFWYFYCRVSCPFSRYLEQLL